MLMQFSVGNYRSFKELVTLSMVAAKLKSAVKSLDQDNLFPISDSVSLLRSAAMYGANASGKSNLVRALWLMRTLVLESSKQSQADEPIQVESFQLSTETENSPSFFETVFCIDGRRHRKADEGTRRQTRRFLEVGHRSVDRKSQTGRQE